MRCIGAVLELLKVAGREKVETEIEGGSRRQKDRVRQTMTYRGDRDIMFGYSVMTDTCEDCTYM